MSYYLLYAVSSDYTQYFGHAPCLCYAADRGVGRISIEDLAYCAEARVGQMRAKIGQYLFQFTPRSLYAFYRCHRVKVWAKQPRPHSTHVVRAVPRVPIS